MSKTEDIGSKVDEVFPVGKTEEGKIVKRSGEYSDAKPSYREKQRKAIIEVAKGIDNPDVDVVLLNAPTGAGKSLILYGASKATSGSSFITTPLNTLVDQMQNDEFISSGVITIKGRNNYDCINPEDKGTSVDEAICQRNSSFECDIKGKCNYYGRKHMALEHPDVVTNISYIMAEGMVPDHVEGTFGDRRKFIVDECQNVEDFSMGNIQFTVSDRTVPKGVWKNITIPDDKYEDDIDYLTDWLEDEVLDEIRAMADSLQKISVKSKEQTKKFDQMRQFSNRVNNFLNDVEDHEWIAEIDYNIKKNKSNTKKIVFKPVFIGRFLDNLLWDRGDTVVFSSATMPGGNWLNEMGLGDSTVKNISLGSNFPIENRRVICNLDVGKMVSTYTDNQDNREENALSMAKRIMELAIHHEGEKGFVHCRSYSIAKLLRRKFVNSSTFTINGTDYDTSEWFRNNVMMQDRYNREESLQKWKDSDTQVFFSVAMDEGIDLEGDLCRWQALAKVLYPFMTRRMKRRKEIAEDSGNPNDFWDYYNNKAVIQIQQAYGRGVRSKEDRCIFYILDSSAKQLIQMNAELFQTWFLEAVEGLRVDPSRGR